MQRPVVTIPVVAVVPGNIPSALHPYITDQQWTTISEVCASGETDACMISCAAECCICLFTGFWCIFCFHVCCVEGFRGMVVEHKISNLNKSFFGGAKVLSTVGGNLVIDTGPLQPVDSSMVIIQQPGGTQVVQPTVEAISDPNQPKEQPGSYQPVPVSPPQATQPATSATPDPNQPTQQPGSYQPLPTSPPPGATVVSVQPVSPTYVSSPTTHERAVFVTVPNNAAPGTTIEVQTPSKQTLQVTVPQNATAGQQLKVLY